MKIITLSVLKNIFVIVKITKPQRYLHVFSIGILLAIFFFQPQRASAFSLHEIIQHFYPASVKSTSSITKEKVLGVNTSKLLAMGSSNNGTQSNKNNNGLSVDNRVGVLETKLSQLSFLQSQNSFSLSTLDSAGGNILRNSSFEAGGENNFPSQWKAQLDSSSSNTFISKEGIHSGNFGLKFLGGGTGNFGISQPDGKTTPQRTYTLSAYVKVVNASSSTFRLGFWDEYNNKEGNFKNFSFSGTQDWKRISMTITTPGIITDSKNYYPMIQVLGLKSGNIYLDDIQLTEGSVLTVYNTAAAKGGGGVTLGDGSILASNSGDLYPAQSGVGNLGTSGNQWQSLNLSNASIDSNGNLSLNGGVTVGGAATVNGTMTAKGNVVLGSSSSNTITATGLFNSSITPATTTTYDLGSTSLYWNNLYVKTLALSGGQSIGGNLSVTGTLGVTGATTLSSTLALTGAGTFSSTGTFASTLTASNGLTLSTGALSLTSTSGSANLIFSPSTTALNVNSQFNIDTTNNRVGIGTTAPSNKLSVVGGNVDLFGGNLGIGTSSPGASLAVAGGGLFGYSGTQAAPSNGLAVSGNVGIGTSSPGFNLQVVGTTNITGAGTFGSTLGVTGAATFSSTGSFASTLTASNGLTLTTGALNLTATSGSVGLILSNSTTAFNINNLFNVDTTNQRVGIGTTAPTNKLDVNGAVALGTYAGGNAAPSNGLIVSGNVGIGTSTPGSALQVNGAAVIGYGGASFTAPSQGLVVSGNVGIGTSSPVQALHVQGTEYVSGNLGIGTSSPGASLAVAGGALIGYSGTQVAPSNGLAVFGNVGIGTTSPQYKLDVAGGGRFSCGNSTWNTGPATTCSDVAEVYSTDEQLDKGDVIRIVSEGKVGKTTGAYDAIIGVYSTSPGLLVGGDAKIGGGEQAVNLPQGMVPVALAGRVPTKVSTENGSIGVGDILTASSIPGVAMKATKAGPILGSALEAYSGKEIGKVMVFVQSGYFNGLKTKDLLAGLQLDSTNYGITQGVTSQQPDLATLLLAQFIAQKEQLAHKNDALSEITTDRVAAGLEVVTPKVLASEITTKSLSSKENEDLLVQIGNSSQLVLQGKQSTSPAVTIDSLGNAVFAGNITAKKVKADSIEGLQVITDNLVSLSDRVNGLSVQTQNTDKTASQASTPLGQTLSLVNLSVQQAQVGLDMTVVGKVNANGGLVVSGPSEFKANTLFDTLAEFVGSVIFRGDVSFLGRPTFNKDTAGFAVVKKGADAVYVPFQRAYDQNPVVSISITLPKNADQGNQTALEQAILTGDINYIVTSLVPNGFVIKLNKPAPADTTFSWTALSVKDTAVINTSSTTTTSQPTTVTTAQPSPSVSPAVSPAAPTGTQVPTVIPSPSVTLSPAPTASPAPSVSVTPSVSPAPSTVSSQTSIVSPTPIVSPFLTPTPTSTQ